MIAVLYYAYGAPKSRDDIESYFSHILSGKKVPAPMLENIKGMFLTSGYPDFIRSSTERIAKGLTYLLNDKVNEQVRVYPAYKHTAPFLEDAYEQAVRDGATKIITMPINPILSASGGGAVHTEVAALNEGASIPHIAMTNYHLDEALVEVFADRVKRAFDWLSKEGQKNAYVLFTVHSQPINPEVNATYVKQFEELAQAVAEKANIVNYKAVYRSGKPAGWLAPDVKDVMRELTTDGATGFVTCELLSISADVESYIEVNRECQDVTKELNVELAVSEFLGDSFDTVVALANIIENRIK